MRPLCMCMLLGVDAQDFSMLNSGIPHCTHTAFDLQNCIAFHRSQSKVEQQLIELSIKLGIFSRGLSWNKLNGKIGNFSNLVKLATL